MRNLFCLILVAAVGGSAASAAEVVGAKRLRVTGIASPSFDVAEVVIRDYDAYIVSSADMRATAYAPTQRDAFSGVENALDGTSSGASYASAGVAGDYLDIVFFRRFTLGSVQLFAPAGVGDATYGLQIFGLGDLLLYSGTIRGSQGAVGGYDPIAPGTVFDIPNFGGGYTDAGDIAGDRPAGPGDEGEGGTIAAAVVPEPATWALLVGGFGMIGASLRRRRSGFATA